jgi:hypothetical protein
MRFPGRAVRSGAIAGPGPNGYAGGCPLGSGVAPAVPFPDGPPGLGGLPAGRAGRGPVHRIEGRKRFLTGAICHDGALTADAEGVA